MTSDEQTFSPAMMNALQAVARMKGDSAIDWLSLLAEDQPDDRYAQAAADPQQGWKPAGR